jgi:hypothetical protein
MLPFLLFFFLAAHSHMRSRLLLLFFYFSASLLLLCVHMLTFLVSCSSPLTHIQAPDLTYLFVRYDFHSHTYALMSICAHALLFADAFCCLSSSLLLLCAHTLIRTHYDFPFVLVTLSSYLISFHTYTCSLILIRFHILFESTRALPHMHMLAHQCLLFETCEC